MITVHRIACLVIQISNVRGFPLKSVDVFSLLIGVFMMSRRQLIHHFSQSSPFESLPHFKSAKICRWLLVWMYKVDVLYLMFCVFPVDKIWLNSPWSITYYLLMFLDHILRANSWNCVKRYSDLSSRISEHCFQIWLVTCETFVFAGRAPVDFFSEGIDTDASRYTSIYVIIASLIFNANLFIARCYVPSYTLHSARTKQPSKAASANKPTGRGFIPGALISNILVSYSEIIHDFLIFLDFSIISFFGVWVWKNYIFSELCALMMPFHTMSILIALRTRKLSKSLHSRH